MEVPLLIDDFLRRAASVYADKTAVVDGELRLTYRELKARVDQLSHALRDLDQLRGFVRDWLDWWCSWVA